MVKVRSSLIAITATFALAATVSAQTEVTAEAHLKKASEILAAVPDTQTPLTIKDKGKNEDAAGDIAKLKTRVAALVSNYPAPAGTTGSELEWKMKFSEVERTLARIIGGGSGVVSATVGAAVANNGTTSTGGVVAASPVESPTTATAGTGSTATAVTPVQPGAPVAATGTVSPTGAVTPTSAVNPTGVVNSTGSVSAIGDVTPRAVATEGQPVSAETVTTADSLLGIAAAKVSTIGIKELDPAIRTQLEKVRIELELFYTGPK